MNFGGKQPKNIKRSINIKNKKVGKNSTTHRHLLKNITKKKKHIYKNLKYRETKLKLMIQRKNTLILSAIPKKSEWESFLKTILFTSLKQTPSESTEIFQA